MPNPTDMVTMLDPNGNPGQVSSDKVQSALSAGYKTAVVMIGPKGEQGYVATDKVPSARQSNYAVANQPGVKPMATPDGQLTFALPNEVDQFVSSGHTALNNDGTVDQAYQYKKYGLDVKGKISNHQTNAVREYDINKGNFTPDTSTAGDMVDNSYEPSDEALKSVGVDPGAYRNNKSVATRAALAGNPLPEMNQNGDITGGSSGVNPIRAAKSLAKAIPSTVGGVYHAFADDPRNEEEANRPTGTLGIHRLLIDPNVDLLQKSAESFRQGNVADGLAHALGGVLPLVGPMAHNIAEGLISDDGNERAEAIGNLLAVATADKVTGVAGKAVKGAVDTGLSTISRAAGEATPKVISTIASTAGKISGGLIKTGVKAGAAVAPYAGDYLSGLSDSLTGAVTDKIVDLTKGSSQDAISALKSIRDTAVQKLSDSGITGDAANAAANDLMGRIQDKFLESGKPPSVSGGAPDAEAEPVQTSSVLRDLHGTVGDWISGLKDKLNVPDDATPISKAANTPAGAPLKAVATPGQMAGGVLAVLEKMVRQEGMGVGQHIADKFDVPARAAAEQSLNNALDGLSPETANMTQQERIDFVSKQLPQPLSAHAQALIDFNRKMSQHYSPTGAAAMEATRSPAMRANNPDLALREQLSGKPGEMDPGVAFSRMQRMSTDEFLNVLSKAKENAPAVRQGYVRYLAESTRDPETGAYRFSKMNDLVKDNYGKLGTDASQFKTLSEGLTELEKQMNTSNTKARSLVQSALGTLMAGTVAVVLEGANPLKVLGTTAGEILAYKLAAPRLVDLLMNPRNVSDLNLVFRAASKVPEGTINDKQLRQAAQRLKKNVAQPLMDKVTESLNKRTGK